MIQLKFSYTQERYPTVTNEVYMCVYIYKEHSIFFLTVITYWSQQAPQEKR